MTANPARPDALLTIGQLAREAGVSRSLLRYYEEQGLLRPAGRTPAGYRLYAPDATETLLFIQRAQRLGFALRDIQLLLDRVERGALLDETVARVAEERYLALERQLTELLVLRHEMGAFLLELRARTGRVGTDSADVYQRLVQRVCGHESHESPAGSTLGWLLDRTGCRLASIERDTVLAALQGTHLHVWRDGEAYRVLIPGDGQRVADALTAIARIEADCHAHDAPRLERTEEGFLFTATGAHAFLFAQFFLDLEAENAMAPPRGGI
jgi:DNA-binding transcriptional MerR regulator